MTRKSKRQVLLFIILLFAAIIIWRIAASGNSKAPAAKGPDTAATAVQVVVLKPDTGLSGIRVTGTLLANEQVELRSQVNGRVIDIHFEEGGFVKQGQLLLKMDDRELRADLSRVDADLTLAESEAGRREKLQELGGISREEYEQSYTRIKTLQAERQRLLALISNANVYAPFSGQIGLRNVSPGGYVTNSDVLATLLQTDPVKVEFSVPEQYAQEIKEGMKVTLSVLNGGEVSAIVFARDPGIDPSTRTVKVRAKASNTAGQLIPGSFAEVSVPVEKGGNGFGVPSEALISEIDGSKVLVIRDGKAVKTSVTVGYRGPRMVYLIAGVGRGDTIITTGLLTLREGAPVKAVLPTSATAL